MGYTPRQTRVHGFRATTRTLPVEVLREKYDHIERMFAHMARDPNDRAYSRAEFIEKRRGMMNRRADYLDNLREKARKVHASHTENS